MPCHCASLGFQFRLLSAVCLGFEFCPIHGPLRHESGARVVAWLLAENCPRTSGLYRERISLWWEHADLGKREDAGRAQLDAHDLPRHTGADVEAVLVRRTCVRPRSTVGSCTHETSESNPTDRQIRRQRTELGGARRLVELCDVFLPHAANTVGTLARSQDATRTAKALYLPDYLAAQRLHEELERVRHALRRRAGEYLDPAGSAANNMQHATDNMQRTVCMMQQATGTMQQTTGTRQQTTGTRQHADMQVRSVNRRRSSHCAPIERTRRRTAARLLVL